MNAVIERIILTLARYIVSHSPSSPHCTTHKWPYMEERSPNVITKMYLFTLESIFSVVVSERGGLPL